MKDKKYTKAGELARWATLPDANPLKAMEIIPYKSAGSKYGACGIRIDGTPEFIDAVLSKLKELIDGENAMTRLELARSVVDGSGINKKLPNATNGAECCYIRLHERGDEGKIMNARYGSKAIKNATYRCFDMAEIA